MKLCQTKIIEHKTNMLSEPIDIIAIGIVLKREIKIKMEKFVVNEPKLLSSDIAYSMLWRDDDKNIFISFTLWLPVKGILKMSLHNAMKHIEGVDDFTEFETNTLDFSSDFDNKIKPLLDKMNIK